MLSKLIEKLSTDPFNPDLNFKAAVEYDKLNQTASAVSFYQRAVEYGTGVLVYTALLKMSLCFERQGDRKATVFNNALQAVAYMPERPEGCFVLSRMYETLKEWQLCYTWAELGLERSNTGKNTPLFSDVGYHGPYVLIFEKAVSAWWIGRRKESKELFLTLSQLEIDQEYKDAIYKNLLQIS